ncbi:MAG: ribonuclease HI [Lachnospirales bacterium]
MTVSTSDVIIVAGGNGTRFGSDVKKQFIEINSVPIIAITINAFEKSSMDNIYVVVQKEDVQFIKDVVKTYGFSKVKGVFIGGAQRYQSVYNGLLGVLDTPSELIFIHDGARPFVSPRKINELLESVKEKGSCILGKKATDTLKVVDKNGFVRKTINRDEVYHASTPQGFFKTTIFKAYEKAVRENINFTDESSVLEYYGEKVAIVLDDENNIKITHREDLEKAEAILNKFDKNIHGDLFKGVEDDSKDEKVSVNEKEISIYTDGACSGNPGRGGYGIVMLYGDVKKEFSDGFLDTTNNRMELLAVIEALKKLNKSCDVTLYSDSKYVIDSVEKKWVYNWQKKGWKKSDGKPALNIDLWKELLPLLETHKVTFVWVKGHNNNLYNERCDLLAREAINKEDLKIDKKS